MAKAKSITPARRSPKQMKEIFGPEGENTEIRYSSEPLPPDQPRELDYDAIGDIVGAHRYGMPYLLRREDIQAYFHLSKRSAQRFIKRYLVPMGCVVQVGRRYLIQPWGVYRLLNPNGRCAYCGITRGGVQCNKVLKFSVMDDEKHFKKHTGKKAPIKEL